MYAQYIYTYLHTNTHTHAHTHTHTRKQARKVEERIQDEMRKELAMGERQEAIRQVPPPPFPVYVCKKCVPTYIYLSVYPSHIHTCTYIHTCVCVYLCLYVYQVQSITHTYMYLHTHMCLYVCLYVYLSVCLSGAIRVDTHMSHHHTPMSHDHIRCNQSGT